MNEQVFATITKAAPPARHVARGRSWRPAATLSVPVEGDNPWFITTTEARYADAVIAHGSMVAAGRALGRSPRRIETVLASVRYRMGIDSTLQALIWWDRWRRGEDR